jgi:hypothetical protein
MGDQLGVFDNNEVGNLTPQQREQQKQRILELLQNNPEIRAIINQDPRILTRDRAINGILRRELGRP